MNEEEKKIIDQLDEDSNATVSEEGQEYREIMKGIQAHGERELRSELDGFLDEHLKGQKSYKKYWISLAVAASVALVIVALNWSSQEQPENPMQLQFNQIPVKADSAVFQQKDSLKQEMPADDVDK